MKLISISRLFFLSILISIPFAGNTQIPTAYGPRSKSMAGAGIANVENSLWGNLNPGGLVFLGQKSGLGIAFLSPTASYQVIGEPTSFEPTLSSQWSLGLQPGLVEAEKKLNIVPHLGFNMVINEESTIGISIYGNSNRGYSYETKTYYSPIIADFGSNEGFINPMGTVSSPTFMELNQYFASISYSRKIGGKIGIGLSAIGAWQSLNLGGLEAFGSLNYSAHPQELTNNDMDNSFGIGGKIGVQWNASEKVQLAVAYQTKIYMSNMESYQGFISESGKLDIPAEWNIGVVYHPFDRFLMALDVSSYCYSGVDSWALSMRQNNSVQLGGENGGGFGRMNQLSYKFGVQYKIPKWQFRAGYAHSDHSIVESEVLLNLLMPEITNDYASIGLSRNIGKRVISIAVVKGFKNSFVGYNNLDTAQLIELNTESWTMELAIEF
ncbi:MAG: hypothetical protein GQ527_00590 [Bacteroidales bacterium]|nr:hypothetical protein [Bacteroidales bacterium]